MQRSKGNCFSSVAQSCPTLCDPMNHSTPDLPVHHQLPEFTQSHVHRVCDAIQPSHPRSSPSPPAPNPSQHQNLFQWVNSSHEVAERNPRADLLQNGLVGSPFFFSPHFFFISVLRSMKFSHFCFLFLHWFKNYSSHISYFQQIFSRSVCFFVFCSTLWKMILSL